MGQRFVALTIGVLGNGGPAIVGSDPGGCSEFERGRQRH